MLGTGPDMWNRTAEDRVPALPNLHSTRCSDNTVVNKLKEKQTFHIRLSATEKGQAEKKKPWAESWEVWRHEKTRGQPWCGRSRGRVYEGGSGIWQGDHDGLQRLGCEWEERIGRASHHGSDVIFFIISKHFFFEIIFYLQKSYIYKNVWTVLRYLSPSFLC